MKQNQEYVTPLTSRYASDEMKFLWSNQKKYTTWRKLWIALAETEKELGLAISNEQIEQMKQQVEKIDYELVEKKEAECRHDVMAHIYAFGKICPKAKPILHLGATSCYVTDNTDILLIKEGLQLIRKRILQVLFALKRFAFEQRKTVCLGYTHFQPAQLTTIGKRATLWMQDLVEDLEEIGFVLENLKLLGCKGTTGTQESFMKLFEEEEKVKQIDTKIAEKMGMKKVFSVSGQTYTRKVDTRVVNCLSQIAQSCTKFATDLRLLQHEKELEEPFEKNQVGSSAMAYKRNPMRSERICSLARHVMALTNDTNMTASAQWLERTLDDSANKRICIPEAFLATEAILLLYANIIQNIVVYPKVIEKHIKEELPFMAIEEILMKAVLKGGDRQQLHEKIRQHSMEATKQVKEKGKENDLVKRIAQDSTFRMNEEEIEKAMLPEKLCGRAVQQVEEFLKQRIDPLFKEQKELFSTEQIEIKV